MRLYYLWLLIWVWGGLVLCTQEWGVHHREISELVTGFYIFYEQTGRNWKLSKPHILVIIGCWEYIQIISMPRQLNSPLTGMGISGGCTLLPVPWWLPQVKQLWQYSWASLCLLSHQYLWANVEYSPSVKNVLQTSHRVLLSWIHFSYKHTNTTCSSSSYQSEVALSPKPHTDQQLKR